MIEVRPFWTQRRRHPDGPPTRADQVPSSIVADEPRLAEPTGTDRRAASVSSSAVVQSTSAIASRGTPHNQHPMATYGPMIEREALRHAAARHPDGPPTRSPGRACGQPRPAHRRLGPRRGALGPRRIRGAGPLATSPTRAAERSLASSRRARARATRAHSTRLSADLVPLAARARSSSSRRALPRVARAAQSNRRHTAQPSDGGSTTTAARVSAAIRASRWSTSCALRNPRTSALDPDRRCVARAAQERGGGDAQLHDDESNTGASSVVDDQLSLSLSACCHPASRWRHESRPRCDPWEAASHRRDEGVPRQRAHDERTMCSVVFRARSRRSAMPPSRSGCRLRTASRAGRRRPCRPLSHLQRGLPPTSGTDLVRTDLADEAIWLTTQLHALLPASPRSAALAPLSLMELHEPGTRHVRTSTGTSSRSTSKIGGNGTTPAFGRRRRGSTTLPGAIPSRGRIAALHATAQSIDDTDWDEIARLYDELLLVAPTPIVALNRAVAVGMARGPDRGFERSTRSTIRRWPATRGWPREGRHATSPRASARGDAFVPTSTRGRDQRGGPALPVTPAS